MSFSSTTESAPKSLDKYFIAFTISCTANEWCNKRINVCITIINRDNIFSFWNAEEIVIKLSTIMRLDLLLTPFTRNHVKGLQPISIPCSSQCNGSSAGDNVFPEEGITKSCSFRAGQSFILPLRFSIAILPNIISGNTRASAIPFLTENFLCLSWGLLEIF